MKTLPGAVPMLLALLFWVPPVAVVQAQDGAYRGPARPGIPADKGPIKVKLSECIAETREMAPDWDEHEIKDTAQQLCELRAGHKAARDRLLGDLAKLVQAFKDETNHDHAQRLPRTIKSIQDMVRDCLSALDSQQWCHNLACNSIPEDNATLCDTKAAEVAEALLPAP